MDRISKFFRGMIVSQFILVLIFGILMFLNFRKQKLLNVRGFHPFEFYYGVLAPLIFFGICLVICVPILLSKHQDQETDENEILKNLRQHNFWKFAFYCNIFFLIIVAFFSIIVFKAGSLVVDHIIIFYWWIFLRALLLILVSLVVASFLLVSGIYWKTNKIIAIVILVASFFIVSISILFDAGSLVEFISHSKNYTALKNSHEISNEAIISEESYEGDNAEDVESKLLSSWNHLVEDWIAMTGERNFSDVRISIKQSMDDHIVENDYFYLMDFIDHLRDSPEKLYSEFENYNSVLYKVVSPKVYHISNLDKIVDGLLLTYDDLSNDEDKLTSIYSTMKTFGPVDDDPDLDTYYPQLEKYFSEQSVEKLENTSLTNGNKFNQEDIIWFYSFWARRNYEGNMKEVAIILNEIKEHYNPTSINVE
ncbi:hypothetical protein EV144_107166 [Flavobacterium sp. 270]|uniref:hypothetical protein n=1 Tax=Flavobacterium sp. 270 TaxID=2512114 RepID=UPI0010668288|nr:hypothetical protein [Flavobacterium sp. 270]TDW45973.1 hypothetical protein EV144_107166 [Flavobacterium sp. 270]